MTLYRQCRLRRDTTFTYTWLPLKVAVVCKGVVLGGESGWVVDEVYVNVTKSKDEIFILGDSHKRQRGVSDV